jgi:hypothetical protein
MATPYISELKLVSFNFAPKGWALANGQLLPINQNQALFSLVGTTYGGDGRVNFGLPNLQSRVPIHMGNGFSLGARMPERPVTPFRSTRSPATRILFKGLMRPRTLAIPPMVFWPIPEASRFMPPRITWLPCSPEISQRSEGASRIRINRLTW